MTQWRVELQKITTEQATVYVEAENAVAAQEAAENESLNLHSSEWQEIDKFIAVVNETPEPDFGDDSWAI